MIGDYKGAYKPIGVDPKRDLKLDWVILIRFDFMHTEFNFYLPTMKAWRKLSTLVNCILTCRFLLGELVCYSEAQQGTHLTRNRLRLAGRMD